MDDLLLCWTLREARDAADVESLLAGFGAMLREAGVPVQRINLPLRARHPLARIAGWTWFQTSKGPRTAHRTVTDFDATWYAQYQRSPFPLVLDQGVDRVRRRLCDPDCPDDFGVLAELRENGVTDYLVLAGELRAGDRVAATFACREDGGFSDAEVDALARALPALLLHVERLQAHALAATVCDTYLGTRTGKRVLDGAIRRGEVERVHAVVGFCDLRGFTATSASSSPEDVTELLNHWFDHVATAVHATGGEILKFIGDAVLVVWPVDGDEGDACRRALATAQGLAARPLEGLRGGLALHVGEVAYGNIGAADRLDFTVIGAAVNLASRLEGLCGRLGVPWVVSDAVAAHAGGALCSLGSFSLKGVPGEVEVFGPGDAP